MTRDERIEARDNWLVNAEDAFRQIKVLAADGASTQSECRWIATRALEAYALFADEDQG